VRARAWNAFNASSSRQLCRVTRPASFNSCARDRRRDNRGPAETRMHVASLAVFVLHHVAEAAVEHAGEP